LDPVKGTILWSQKNIIGGSVDSAVAVH